MTTRLEPIALANLIKAQTTKTILFKTLIRHDKSLHLQLPDHRPSWKL